MPRLPKRDVVMSPNPLVFSARRIRSLDRATKWCRHVVLATTRDRFGLPTVGDQRVTAFPRRPPMAWSPTELDRHLLLRPAGPRGHRKTLCSRRASGWTATPA